MGLTLLEGVTTFIPDTKVLPTRFIYQADVPITEQIGGHANRIAFRTSIGEVPMVAKIIPDRTGAEFEVTSEVYAQTVASSLRTPEVEIAVPMPIVFIHSDTRVIGFASPYLGKTIPLTTTSWNELTVGERLLFRDAVLYYLPVFASRGIRVDGHDSGLRRNIVILQLPDRKVPMFYDMGYMKDRSEAERNAQELLARINFDMPWE